MKKYTIIALGLLLHASALMAQDSATPLRDSGIDKPVVLAETITATELERHLTVLASDEFEGRETGTEGIRKAAAYITEVFDSYGLPRIGDNGTFYQPFSYIAETWEKVSLTVNGDDTRHLWDYYALPAVNADKVLAGVKEVIFLGYGIDDAQYSDYKGVDVKGKTILIYGGEPRRSDGRSYLTDTDGDSEWTTDVRKKLRTAQAKGAEMVLVIDTDFKKNMGAARKLILGSSMKMGWGEQADENFANSLFLSTDLARKIAGKGVKKMIAARDQINQTGQPKSLKLKSKLEVVQQKKVRQLLGENIMAYIEGSDPVLKDELVVVTAHYDHIGMRGDDVFNGADDNGSGTSSVLEVTQAMLIAKQNGWGPRRSVLCMLVAGEEKGLLGSDYYVEHPAFPLENTVANINVDMVGRVDQKHADNPNYIYVIGSDRLSTALHEINETANKTYTNLELDYTYNAMDDPNRFYYRSDHYNFAKKGIPAVFYFNGTHEDYHGVGDTVDKINFAKMETIARLVFHTAWELANRDERIKVDVEGKN